MLVTKIPPSRGDQQKRTRSRSRGSKLSFWRSAYSEHVRIMRISCIQGGSIRDTYNDTNSNSFYPRITKIRQHMHFLIASRPFGYIIFSSQLYFSNVKKYLQFQQNGQIIIVLCTFSFQFHVKHHFKASQIFFIRYNEN